MYEDNIQERTQPAEPFDKESKYWEKIWNGEMLRKLYPYELFKVNPKKKKKLQDKI